MNYVYSILREKQLELISRHNKLENMKIKSKETDGDINSVIADYKQRINEVTLAMEIVEEEMMK